MTRSPAPAGETQSVQDTGQSHRDGIVRNTLWIVLVLNLVVATSKLAVGAVMGSLSLTADGVHSLLDASSNVVGLIGIVLAAKPADAGHPYGHRRFETLAALVIGMLIAVGGVEILREIVEGLIHGRPPPEVTVHAVGVVVATIVINLGISAYERAQGRKAGSDILQADAAHTLSDAMAAGAVLVSFGAVALKVPWADLAGAIVVCGFIGTTAFRILRANLKVLSDHATLDPKEVHEVATSVTGVHGAHRIRSRGSAQWVQIDLHVHLDPELSLEAAHAKTHEVIRAIQQQFPEVKDVLIHTEPADGREQDHSKMAPGDG